MRTWAGSWTKPGTPLPSSHLLVSQMRTRCGRLVGGATVAEMIATVTDEPPANGKTCERCLVLSRRDS